MSISAMDTTSNCTAGVRAWKAPCPHRQPASQHTERCLVCHVCLRNIERWASLVAQWLKILLPMQGTRVRALVQEDPTCRGATKPMRHSY